jgi:hypothetical protein
LCANTDKIKEAGGKALGNGREKVQKEQRFALLYTLAPIIDVEHRKFIVFGPVKIVLNILKPCKLSLMESK